MIINLPRLHPFQSISTSKTATLCQSHHQSLNLPPKIPLLNPIDTITLTFTTQIFFPHNTRVTNRPINPTLHPIDLIFNFRIKPPTQTYQSSPVPGKNSAKTITARPPSLPRQQSLQPALKTSTKTGTVTTSPQPNHKHNPYLTEQIDEKKTPQRKETQAQTSPSKHPQRY